MRKDIGDSLFLFNVKHLSIRAKTTNKVKTRTLKKWNNRVRKMFKNSRYETCSHTWVRASTTSTHTRFLSGLLVWSCLKCGCGATKVDPKELSEPMRLAYCRDADESNTSSE